ncbi:DUF2188 domain-containing protein [Modicisalibacter luteus]|uniref:DUF2188 domain-containing protein n=1 Tax=Modicisalibacter luteus TaxID=453962 RepID=A0ABV7M433_9GAMM|nr:DUF2188 domain-containing protein [Halomonas lutea]GHA85357.1 hypothetical protein GCM10007159_03070 [Halomonas lutea]
MADNIWVVVHGDTEWAVRKESSKQPAQITKTQEEAIEAGREMAKQLGVELLIQGEDGMIRDKNSYGNDPYPPSG